MLESNQVAGLTQSMSGQEVPYHAMRANKIGGKASKDVPWNFQHRHATTR